MQHTPGHAVGCEGAALRGWRGGLPALLASLAIAFGSACASRGFPGRSERGAEPADRIAAAVRADLPADAGQRARILASPFRLFRFANISFSREVCAAFQDLAGRLAPVNLHGDAHLEQYAVSDTGWGLTDFDDSSRGPAVLDLVRFGASLRLAAREQGWPRPSRPDVVGEVLRGYHAALEDPTRAAYPPPIVDRLRAGFSDNPLDKVAQAEAKIQPTIGGSPALRQALRRMAEETLSRRPELPRDFFEIKRFGRLDVGVGSATLEKFLLRVEGPSRDASDDLMLEVKEVRDLSGIGCIEAGESDPLRILAGLSRLSKQPYRLVGFLTLPEDAARRDFPWRRTAPQNFWVHVWAANYRELAVQDVASPAELAGIAYDVGFQLGQGHPRQTTDLGTAEARQVQLAALELTAGRVLREADELSAAVEDAWEELRSLAPPAARATP